MNQTIHQWNSAQLNIFEAKSIDAFEISNNCKPWQEKLPSLYKQGFLRL
jgi:hypothetical protein